MQKLAVLLDIRIKQSFSFAKTDGIRFCFQFLGETETTNYKTLFQQ